MLALPCFCPIRGGLILGGCTPVPSSVPATSPLPSRFGADARVYNFPACWFLSNGCSWFCVFVASGSGLGPAAPLACLPRQARPGLGWTKQERVPCCRGRGRQALHEELRVCRPKSSPRTEAGMGGVWGSGVVSGVPREGLPEERWFVKVLRRRAAGWGVAQLRRPVQRPRGATLTPAPGPPPGSSFCQAALTGQARFRPDQGWASVVGGWKPPLLMLVFQRNTRRGKGGARAQRPRKERTPQGESDSECAWPGPPLAGHGLGVGVGAGSGPGRELGARGGPGGPGVLRLRSQTPAKAVASTARVFSHSSARWAFRAGVARLEASRRGAGPSGERFPLASPALGGATALGSRPLLRLQSQQPSLPVPVLWPQPLCGPPTPVSAFRFRGPLGCD